MDIQEKTYDAIMGLIEKVSAFQNEQKNQSRRIENNEKQIKEIKEEPIKKRWALLVIVISALISFGLSYILTTI